MTESKTPEEWAEMMWEPDPKEPHALRYTEEQVIAWAMEQARREERAGFIEAMLRALSTAQNEQAPENRAKEGEEG